MANAPYPLEPDAAAMRRLVDEAMRRIVSHLESLPLQPASYSGDVSEFTRSLIEPLPKEGASYETLLDLLFDQLVPKSFNAAGPGYLAYIPGGGIFFAAVADLIADSVNRYTGVYAAAPALVRIETNVLRWFCEIVGYGAGSGGVLTTGGSLSNFIALVTARQERLPENFLSGTIYVGDQVHHSLMKAARLAGFPERNVRIIPSDGRYRIRVDALAAQLANDRADGFTPFFLAASAGTTSTGAVDDLNALADLAELESLWYHVDGAYGAFFALTDPGKRILRGMERAHSIVLDPHKTLFLPYGTGALVVRDAATLRRAHSSHAEYLPGMQHDADFVDFCEISPELSRDFRGLRLWLPLKMFGIEPFREQLQEKLDLTLWATEQLRTIDGIEIVAEPQLSVVAFRHTALDNRELLDRVNARQRVMITGTVLDGEFVLRICVVSFRTHRDHVAMAIEDIRAAIADLAPSR